MNDQLESYAAHVHKQLLIVMARLAKGRTEEAREHLALLMTEAANVSEGRKMKREAAAPDRYDLTTLPAVKEGLGE